MDNIRQHNEFINCLIAKILRIGILLIVIVGYINTLGIFIIEPKYMNIVVISTIIIFMMPTLLFNGLKIHTFWAQMLVLGLIVLTSGMMYAMLSYHVVIMFVVPVCIACLYNDKKYPIYTMLMTIPVLIISHYIAFYLNVVPDEPLVTFDGVFKFGILPRGIQFVGCSLICIAAAARTHQLIEYLLAAQAKQQQDQIVLKQIIFECEQLIGTHQIEEMLNKSAGAIQNVIRQMGGTFKREALYIVGYCSDLKKQQYTMIDHALGQEKIVLDTIQAPYVWQGKIILLGQDYQPGSEVTLEDELLSMRFYEKGKLTGLIFIPCQLEATNNNMDMLKMLYTNIYESLKNVYLHQEMLTMQKQLIQSLAEICECKSAQTGQHIKRVGEYMKVFGKALQLDEESCETLSMAAMLHDVGKLKVPNEILEKKGKLMPEEFEEIKKHVQYGRDLLENCSGEIMEIGKIIAYQHHEKWDGTGYLKLTAHQINEYAALVAVIDVFDALVSKRSYKDAWTADAAYDEIINGCGSHFSPQAVALFKETYPELLKVLATYPD